MFSRNYFGIFKEETLEHNGKVYREFNPKEVIKRNMKFKYLSPDGMDELKIVDILNEDGKEIDQATCNTPKVFILTDRELGDWTVLYE